MLGADRACRVSAVFSECGNYRYALIRDGWLGGEGAVLFVMLNPSTADATSNDPTTRRCIGFAQRWGFASLAIANLYAYRATVPAPGTFSRVHVCIRGKGSANGGWYESAEYRYVPGAPVELLRDNAQWRSWVVMTVWLTIDHRGPIPTDVAADLAALSRDDFCRAARAIGAYCDPDGWLPTAPG